MEGKLPPIVRLIGLVAMLFSNVWLGIAGFVIWLIAENGNYWFRFPCLACLISSLVIAVIAVTGIWQLHFLFPPFWHFLAIVAGATLACEACFSLADWYQPGFLN